MRPLTHDLLRELATHDAPLCISLFLEVAAGGGDHRQIRTALKTAKAEAARLVEDAPVDADVAAAVRARLDAVDYADVAGGHDRRIAIFIGPDLTEVVDARFEETGVHAGARFRLAPLIGDLSRTPDHAVLVASQDAARLYRAEGGALRQQAVKDMPASLSEVSRFTDQQEKGNIHGREDSGAPGRDTGAQAAATGPQGVPHHSMGGHDWREDKDADLRRYANLLANSAQHHLSGTNLPLVIVADERLHGMIRENSEYPFLAADGVYLHPGELDEGRIRDTAAACLAQDATRRREAAWDKVAMSLGRADAEASDDPADIVTASAAGRVAHLFVRGGASLPGRIEEPTLAAEAAEDGPEDLVDRAIVETLRNGGEVFALGDRGGEATVMAAAYRYPA
jgi:hypothetical protein